MSRTRSEDVYKRQDEIDIVLNVGRMLTGEYDEAANEVEVIRSELDEDVVLKVCLLYTSIHGKGDAS